MCRCWGFYLYRWVDRSFLSGKHVLHGSNLKFPTPDFLRNGRKNENYRSKTYRRTRDYRWSALSRYDCFLSGTTSFEERWEDNDRILRIGLPGLPGKVYVKADNYGNPAILRQETGHQITTPYLNYQHDDGGLVITTFFRQKSWLTILQSIVNYIYVFARVKFTTLKTIPSKPKANSGYLLSQ